MNTDLIPDQRLKIRRGEAGEGAAEAVQETGAEIAAVDHRAQPRRDRTVQPALDNRFKCLFYPQKMGTLNLLFDTPVTPYHMPAVFLLRIEKRKI